ncbi:MAG: sigma-E factor negative regulatory protein [Woeseiaceae bacterium]|nr:sigma-E factor negative regulatory protein [Woeseiaceae bacterium]
MNEAIRMQLSAFVDGELPDNEKELLLRRLSQDEELRRELARHLAIGRAMRGELQPAGVDVLRDRINAAIDAGDDLELPDEDTGPDRRIRPLAGFAIAASVALVAILGLQQMTSVDVSDTAARDLTAETVTMTEPPIDEVLRQYMLHHEANGPENNINTVLTSIEIAGEAIEEQQDTDAETTEDVTEDATDTAVTEEPAAE